MGVRRAHPCVVQRLKTRDHESTKIHRTAYRCAGSKHPSCSVYKSQTLHCPSIPPLNGNVPSRTTYVASLCLSLVSFSLSPSSVASVHFRRHYSLTFAAPSPLIAGNSSPPFSLSSPQPHSRRHKNRHISSPEPPSALYLHTMSKKPPIPGLLQRRERETMPCPRRLKYSDRKLLALPDL